jgi:hypothetical protein
MGEMTGSLRQRVRAALLQRMDANRRVWTSYQEIGLMVGASANDVHLVIFSLHYEEGAFGPQPLFMEGYFNVVMR